MLATYPMGTPGGRPALLAHCFLGHAGPWERLLAQMQTPLQALAFDLPGHGKSPMPARVGDFHAEVTAQVPGLLAQLPPGPALGMGHSFGGAVLLRQALLAPGSLDALVLIEPVFFAAARGTPEYADWLAQDAPIQAHLAAGEPAEAARLFLAQNGDGTPWDAIPARQRAAITRLIAMMPGTMPGLGQDSGNLQAPGLMEGFDRPVLLLAGSESPPIFRAICHGLAARLPRAEVQVVPGAGHMLPITHTAPVASRIDAWLARTGTRAGPRAGT
jgi:lipase